MSEQSEDRSQFLTFRLAEVRYALPVGRVEEVLENQRVTRVPRAPEVFRGIVNVRGRVIPVMDLRRRFDLDAVEIDSETRFIVMTVHMTDEEISIAAIADAVEGVVAIDPASIDPPPKIGSSSSVGLQAAGEAVSGISKADDSILLILDPDKVLTLEYLHAGYEELRRRNGG